MLQKLNSKSKSAHTVQQVLNVYICNNKPTQDILQLYFQTKS